jgi:hypothetical protein
MCIRRTTIQHFVYIGKEADSCSLSPTHSFSQRKRKRSFVVEQNSSDADDDKSIDLSDNVLLSDDIEKDDDADKTQDEDEDDGEKTQDDEEEVSLQSSGGGNTIKKARVTPS